MQKARAHGRAFFVQNFAEPSILKRDPPLIYLLCSERLVGLISKTLVLGFFCEFGRVGEAGWFYHAIYCSCKYERLQKHLTKLFLFAGKTYAGRSGSKVCEVIRKNTYLALALSVDGKRGAII